MNELARGVISLICIFLFIIFAICSITLSIKDIVRELKQRRKK